MKTAKQQVNDMIYKTLRTRADKPAKFADRLRELGYEVTDRDIKYDGTRHPRTYWSVNGLEVDRFEGETATLYLGRGQHVSRFDEIKKIDFVDYFAKLESRMAKWHRMKAHDNIEQERVRKYRYFYETHRYATVTVTNDTNHEIAEYKRLKAASMGGAMCYGDRFISHLEFRRDDVERAEQKLEMAKKELERAKAALAEEEAKMADKSGELHEFLAKRGIREKDTE